MELVTKGSGSMSYGPTVREVQYIEHGGIRGRGPGLGETVERGREFVSDLVNLRGDAWASTEHPGPATAVEKAACVYPTEKTMLFSAVLATSTDPSTAKRCS